MRALFPCGSVTGAPKIRAMEIIDEIEAGRRGPYTGSLGFAAPSGDLRFNVMIRTAVIGDDGEAAVGIGGGIVADSRAAGEYEECLLKLRFFSEPYVPMSLIETMAWEKDRGFVLLDRHLEPARAIGRLFRHSVRLSRGRGRRSRMLFAGLPLPAFGYGCCSMKTEFQRLPPSPLEVSAARPWRFVLSSAPTSSADRFLYHKTTRRTFYDRGAVGRPARSTASMRWCFATNAVS